MLAMADDIFCFVQAGANDAFVAHPHILHG